MPAKRTEDRDGGRHARPEARGAPRIPIPTPAECRRPKAPGGVAVTLCDGNAWELALGGLWPRLRAFRDAIFDGVVLSRSAPVATSGPRPTGSCWPITT